VSDFPRIEAFNVGQHAIIAMPPRR